MYAVQIETAGEWADAVEAQPLQWKAIERCEVERLRAGKPSRVLDKTANEVVYQLDMIGRRQYSQEGPVSK